MNDNELYKNNKFEIYKDKKDHLSYAERLKASALAETSVGAKTQFLEKAQTRRRMHSDNRKNKKQIYSAGILPFYVKNNTIYFLLGKDYEGKWSDFGGRSEMQDKGRWDVTASREFYEETIGSVMDIPSMLAKLQNKKNFIRIDGKTLNGSPYFMYVVRIPYKEIYRQNFNSTLSFIKYAKHEKRSKNYHADPIIDYKYMEKLDIQWVSLETIKLTLNDRENYNVINYPLRSVFKKTFVENISEIVDFCSVFYGIGMDSSVYSDRVSENDFKHHSEGVHVIREINIPHNQTRHTHLINEPIKQPIQQLQSPQPPSSQYNHHNSVPAHIPKYEEDSGYENNITFFPVKLEDI